MASWEPSTGEKSRLVDDGYNCIISSEWWWQLHRYGGNSDSYSLRKSFLEKVKLLFQDLLIYKACQFHHVLVFKCQGGKSKMFSVRRRELSLTAELMSWLIASIGSPSIWYWIPNQYYLFHHLDRTEMFQLEFVPSQMDVLHGRKNRKEGKACDSCSSVVCGTCSNMSSSASQSHCAGTESTTSFQPKASRPMFVVWACRPAAPVIRMPVPVPSERPRCTLNPCRLPPSQITFLEAHNLNLNT